MKTVTNQYYAYFWRRRGQNRCEDHEGRSRSCSTLIFLITLLHCAPDVSGASDINNGVVGRPQVECDKEAVRFKVRTLRPFHGKVYVKGGFTNKNCVHTYSAVGKEFVSGGGNDYEDDLGLEVLGVDKRYGGDDRGRTPTSDRILATSKSTSGISTKWLTEDDEKGRSSRPKGDKSEENFEREFFQQNRFSGASQEWPLNKSGGGSKSVLTIFGNNGNNRSSTVLGESSPGGPLPGFNRTPDTAWNRRANWRSFLRGRPDAGDGLAFRRYGSRVSPDFNGECPLQCPPCPQCDRGVQYNQRNRRRTDSSDDDEGNETSDERKERSGGSAELEVPFGACNIKRDRIANPAGVHVSFTVVVSFHDSFITKIDKAYHIECAYEEVDHTVTTQIDVSQPPIVELHGVMEPPRCQYRIVDAASLDEHKSGGGGAARQIANVRVGDPIRHEWYCTSSNQQNNDNSIVGDGDELYDAFGLLVHSCYVDDGKGRKEMVTDSHGCSANPLILPTPSYSSRRLSATVDSLVAKFPDRDLIGFQCSITVCMRSSGQCEGITPPKCDESPSAHRTRRDSNDTTSATPIVGEWLLNAQTLTVFDSDNNYSSEFSKVLSAAHKHEQSHEQQRISRIPHAERLFIFDERMEKFCVSVLFFAIFVASSTFVLTITGGVLITLIFFNFPAFNYKFKRKLLFRQ